MGLIVLVVAVVSVALWRGAKAGAAHMADLDHAQHDPAAANAEVYRDQLQDLSREYELGNLNDEELQTAQDELRSRLLADVQDLPVAPAVVRTTPRHPWVAIAATVVLVPLLSMMLYARLGQPQALDPLALTQGLAGTEEVTPEKLAAMATALTRRLQDEPTSMEGWVMLGRVQRARGLFAESAEALRKALELSRDDDLSIERAEVLAQVNGGVFAGEPWAIIQRVLSANPQHLNALFLAGSASYAEMNFRTALRFWERAREVVKEDSPDAPELDRAIAEARDKLGLPPIPPRAAAAAPAKAAAISAVSVSGRVSLVNELKSQVAPTDTVFVYATAVNGSRMPVAIVRTTADKLPYDFVLDDSTAMNPSVKLSDMAEVTVRVRISKSGQAMAQPGDLGVSLTPVKPGSKGLNLMVREALQNTP
jgi:cytochrome c-type biogenesis protein CcmH